ncbi:hypothetical protein D3C78_1051350 [compost metagenome]
MSALEGKHAPYIGEAAHQIEIEVRLEDWLRRLQTVVTTFIGVQAQSIFTQGHTFGHYHQRMRMQAIARLQKKHPVCSISAGNTGIKLVKTIAT